MDVLRTFETLISTRVGFFWSKKHFIGIKNVSLIFEIVETMYHKVRICQEFLYIGM